MLPHESFVWHFLLIISYIYNYTNHLENVRISFGRNSAEILEITHVNNYYPLGLSHVSGNKGASG